jgi:hypothetical protein
MISAPVLMGSGVGDAKLCRCAQDTTQASVPHYDRNTGNGFARQVGRWGGEVRAAPGRRTTNVKKRAGHAIDKFTVPVDRHKRNPIRRHRLEFL